MKRLLSSPIFSSQAFWVFGMAIMLMIVMSLCSETFATRQNLFNIMRNMSFIAIMALGMTPVLISGGLDLSVGSIMALSAMVTGITLQAGAPLYLGLAAGLATGLLCGSINGYLVAHAKFNPFIVTIAMLSAARSLALVISNGKSFFQFGPDADVFAWLGGGEILGIPNPVIIGALLMLLLALALHHLRWGLYVYALGANEKAVLAAGVAIARVKFSVYLLSSLTAAMSAILMTGWLGGVTNNLGSGYELTVIAATVIGGVSLMGGYGGIYGPVAGAALLEVIRNAFLLAGFNAYWQGFFIGTIIILAMVLQKMHNAKKREPVMRQFSLLLLLLLMGALPAQAKNLVFALVPKSTDNVFFEFSAQGCKKAAADLPNVRCDYIGPHKVDAAEQVQILQDLITRHVDGIAIAADDSATMIGPLKAAKAAGIPVVTYDSDLLEKDRSLRAVYIGTNNYAIGERLAQALQKFHPGGGTICIQSGTPGEENLNERVRGVRETLSGRKGTTGVGERLNGENGWQEVGGSPLMNEGDYTITVKQLDETLAKQPQLTAFVAVGGWAQLFPAGYREVVGRYKDRILGKKTLIITADTLPPQMELVAEGLSHVNVGQRPFDMGYKAMEALKDLVDGKKVADPLYTGLNICTPETYKTCLNR